MFPPRFSPRGAARHRLAMALGRAPLAPTGHAVLTVRSAGHQPRGLPLPPLKGRDSKLGNRKIHHKFVISSLILRISSLESRTPVCSRHVVLVLLEKIFTVLQATRLKTKYVGAIHEVPYNFTLYIHHAGAKSPRVRARRPRPYGKT